MLHIIELLLLSLADVYRRCTECISERIRSSQREQESIESDCAVLLCMCMQESSVYIHNQNSNNKINWLLSKIIQYLIAEAIYKHTHTPIPTINRVFVEGTNDVFVCVYEHYVYIFNKYTFFCKCMHCCFWPYCL